MWFYPWKDRIRDTIRAHSPRYYAEDQIASLCSLPLGARGEIRRIVSDLVREGVLEEVLPGRWGARLDEASTRRREQMIMEQELKLFIRASLRGRKYPY